MGRNALRYRNLSIIATGIYEGEMDSLLATIN
jgi:hypothetical protein